MSGAMKDPSDPLQEAYVGALKASSDVKAVLGDPARVFDKVPAQPTYPYIRVGDDQILPEAYGCANTWEAHVTIHVWSRAAAPRPEVKVIANAIAGVMCSGPDNPPFTPAGFVVEEWEFSSSNTNMEADGVTAHGVLVFRYILVDAA